MRDYLTLGDVLAIHADQITTYGGAAGTRDPGRPDAALFRPQTGYYADTIAEAAAPRQRGPRMTLHYNDVGEVRASARPVERQTVPRVERGHGRTGEARRAGGHRTPRGWRCRPACTVFRAKGAEGRTAFGKPAQRRRGVNRRARSRSVRSCSVMSPKSSTRRGRSEPPPSACPVSDYVLDIPARRRFLERLQALPRVELSVSAADLVREGRDGR